MVDPIDVELAMTVIQLTAVLLPVMLGLARYYVNQREHLSHISNSDLMEYISFLSTLLILACIGALIIFLQHGNILIFNSVVAYFFFFLALLFMIPVVVTDSLTRKALRPVIKGGLAAGGAVFVYSLLMILFWFYI